MFDLLWNLWKAEHPGDVVPKEWTPCSRRTAEPEKAKLVLLWIFIVVTNLRFLEYFDTACICTTLHRQTLGVKNLNSIKSEKKKLHPENLLNGVTSDGKRSVRESKIFSLKGSWLQKGMCSEISATSFFWKDPRPCLSTPDPKPMSSRLEVTWLEKADNPFSAHTQQSKGENNALYFRSSLYLVALVLLLLCYVLKYTL